MAVVAVSTRSGLVECEYHGHVVVVGPSGRSRLTVGSPERVTYPRSANKLFQASAMLRLGLDLPTRLLALAASSHSGEDFHQRGTLDILTSAHKTHDDLENTPGLPYDEQVALDVIRTGGGPTRLAQNCSGKHAAMVATCVLQRWPVSGYLDPLHPLQKAITVELETMSGERIEHIGVDGCGAPAHALSLAGLARAYGRARVGDGFAPTVAGAMIRYPEMVGGTRRDVTAVMRALPGVLVKDGAAGVMAASLPDGTGIALKITDGAGPPRIPVLLDVLERLGLDVTAARRVAAVPVLGHGQPVGDVHSVLKPDFC